MNTILTMDTAGDKSRTQQPARAEPGSSGMVLVVVVILATVAGILAGGLYYASGSRIVQVQQALRFEKAFFIAEAGIERAKAELRSNPTNLNTVFFGGFTNYGGGQFYVNGQTSGLPTNCVLLRSTGIVAQATRVIEARLLVTPPEPYVPGISDGAVSIYGTNTSLYLKNSKVHVMGEDYNVPTNFTGNGNACTGEESTNTAAPGVYYTSTNTSITGDGSISGNPPTTNWAGIYTETYWYDVVSEVLPYATMYDEDIGMGTRDAPVVTLLPAGNTKLTGNADGAGILIVPSTATLSVGGTFHYEGLLIIIGDGVVDVEDELTQLGTFDFFGSVICLGGALNVEITGDAEIKYSTEALANLSRLELPEILATMNVLTWREIKASSADW